jgi:TPR repeat protein
VVEVAFAEGHLEKGDDRLNWKKTLTGIGMMGCIVMCCGCVKTVTGQYYNVRADQLYGNDQKRQAFEMYYQSAQQGVADSQYMVSQMLLFGDGIQPNSIEGMIWLEKAAQQDHSEAARDMGAYLLSGEFNQSRDPQRGIWFLERAAAGKDSFSMLTLGYLYLTGYGVNRNTETAAYWYGQAAQHGESIPSQWEDAGYLAGFQAPLPLNAKTELRSRVKRAQTGLKLLGYYKSTIDGIAGPGTARAVKQFQKEQQVEINGRIDVALMRQLYRRIVFDPMYRQM